MNKNKNAQIKATPTIAPLPSESEKRLVDYGLLHYEASAAGFSERYARGETSHTIHVWWARRPHTAMRVIIFAALCKANGNNVKALNILNRLGLGLTIEDATLKEAREYLNNQYPKGYKVLDIFGGGGTIPLEALRLGAETYSIDANELSVFIQKGLLVYSQTAIKKDITKIIKKSGEAVLKKLAEETDKIFPERKKDLVGYSKDNLIGYLWTYKTECPECSYNYYLIRRPWLSKKNKKNIAFTLNNKKDTQEIKLEKVDDYYEFAKNWTGKKGQTQCPKCGSVNEKANFKKCKDELIGIIKTKEKFGKEFLLANKTQQPEASKLAEIEKKILKELQIDIPTTELPKWSGIVNPAGYGMETHGDLFNQRQRVVMLYLIQALKQEYNELKAKEDIETAKFTLFCLTGFIDQLVDWNSRLSMWIPQNEQVGRGFCGPGIAMLWDYVEIDPILNGPANLRKKLERIIEGVKSLGKLPRKGLVAHGYAQKLNYEDNFFDAIVTDPPYYDNIFYSILADFFYAWKKLLLQDIEPELFLNAKTDFTNELVSSKQRSGGPAEAHNDYCNNLLKALGEAARVLKPNGTFAFIYSHSSIKGWEALIHAFRNNNLIITSVQPLSIERKQRPRAMTSEAVNTCIAFIARKSYKEKHTDTKESITEIFKALCQNDFIEGLEKAGWNQADTGIAAFAHGVALLSNVKTQEQHFDEQCLTLFESIVKEKCPQFSVKKRGSI